MADKNKSILSTTALVATVGFGVCFVLTRTGIFNKLKNLLNYRNPLRNQVIHIVNDVEECNKVIESLKFDLAKYRVLGFDCEWVTVSGTRHPVALIQLASYTGLCALIRMNHLKKIPAELKVSK